MKIIRIKVDGKMDELDINTKSISKILESLAISKGSSSFKKLYEWIHSSKNYVCYGWFDGDAGFENKHELIPSGISSFLEEDSSEILLFGDIFMVCYQNEKLIDFSVSEYGEIFSILCEGFDDCNTSSDESDDEELSDAPDTDDEHFIVDDKEEVTTDESYISEDELDIDTNSYSDSCSEED
mgnify:CR=1 FL=1|jgi:hypothetical protein